MIIFLISQLALQNIWALKDLKNYFHSYFPENIQKATSLNLSILLSWITK